MKKKTYGDHLIDILDRNEKFEKYSIIGLTGGDEDTSISKRKISYTCELCGDDLVHTIRISDAKQGHGCSGCKARNQSIGRSQSFQRYTDRIHKLHPHIQCIRWLDEEGVSPSQRRIQYHCTHCSELRSSITNDLLKGQGCKCNNRGGYNATTVARNPDKPISLYYIRFDKPDHPAFYKIGLDSTGNRWSSTFKGWSVTELWREDGILGDLFAKEQAILEDFKDLKGYPTEFEGVSGYTEMFSEPIYNLLKG